MLLPQPYWDAHHEMKLEVLNQAMGTDLLATFFSSSLSTISSYSLRKPTENVIEQGRMDDGSAQPTPPGGG